MYTCGFNYWLEKYDLFCHFSNKCQVKPLKSRAKLFFAVYFRHFEALDIVDFVLSLLGSSFVTARQRLAIATGRGGARKILNNDEKFPSLSFSVLSLRWFLF